MGQRQPASCSRGPLSHRPLILLDFGFVWCLGAGRLCRLPSFDFLGKELISDPTSSPFNPRVATPSDALIMTVMTTNTTVELGEMQRIRAHPSLLLTRSFFNPCNTLGGFSICPIPHSRTKSKPNMAFSENCAFLIPGTK